MKIYIYQYENTLNWENIVKYLDSLDKKYKVSGRGCKRKITTKAGKALQEQLDKSNVQYWYD